MSVSTVHVFQEISVGSKKNVAHMQEIKVVPKNEVLVNSYSVQKFLSITKEWVFTNEMGVNWTVHTHISRVVGALSMVGLICFMDHKPCVSMRAFRSEAYCCD